jgi:hypothetical protein
MPIAINQFSLSPLDPTAQKLSDLESRLAKLESVLSVGVNGEATLKSSTSVVIDAGTNLTLRGGVMVKMDSGATMTLKSSATFDLQASATMSLMGSMININ